MLDAYLIKEQIDKAAHEAGMRYRTCWLRAVEGKNVLERGDSGRALSYEETLDIVPQSRRLLSEADDILSPAQKKIILRVCCDDRRAGETDALETLRRGLERLVKLWKL